MTHGKVVCDCGTLISQCRCIQHAHEYRVEKAACPACKKPAFPLHLPPATSIKQGRINALHRLLTAVCEVYSDYLFHGDGTCIHSPLMERNRLSKYVEPRQVGHYAACRLLGLTTTETGEFWLRDHATVSCSIARIEERMKEDGVLRGRVIAVRERYLAFRSAGDTTPFEHAYTALHNAIGYAEFKEDM